MKFLKRHKRVVFRLLVLLVALAVGVFSAHQYKRYVVKNLPTERVVVARKDIPPSTELTREDLAVVSVPAGAGLPGALRDPSQAVGKITAVPVYKGEQILPGKLEGDRALLSLGPDERHLAVPVDAVGSVGMDLRPGNLVDVYSLPRETPGTPVKEETPPPQATLVAERAVVVRVGAGEGGNPSSPEERRQQVVSGTSQAVVVLKVKADQARAVATAVASGKVYLVRRGD